MSNKQNKTMQKGEKNAKKLDTPTDKSGDVTNGAQAKTKLKKPLIIGGSITGGVLILALILLLIFQSSPIGRILTKLEKNESYHMSATISGIPILGSISLERMVDGNVTYTSAFLLSSEQFIEVVGEDTYLYTKSSDGTWTRKKTDSSSNTADDMIEDLIGDVDELTNPKNYERVKGEKYKYKQKDDVDFGGCKDVVITIADDTVTVEMTVSFQGMEMPATVVISRIGEVELTLPEVA